MVKHRDQAKFERAGWKLKVLLPSWVAQISLLVILISTSAYLFSKAVNESVEVRGTAIAWESINIVISVIALLCTAYEILRMITKGLTPKAMLVTNLVKLVGGVLCMIMDGMVTGTSLDGWSDGTLVIHSLLMVSILVSGCYAAWKWKRFAQYDEYHHPGQLKPFGSRADLKQKRFSSHSRILSDDLDWDPDLDMGNNVEIISGSGSGAAAEPSRGVMAPSPGETTPMTPGFARTAGTGRMDFSLTSDVDATNNAAAGAGRSRADTASSLMAVDTAYDPAAATIAVPQRPASYNHARDPAFDEYVRQQQQQHKQRPSQRASSGSSASWSSGAGSSPRESVVSPPGTSPAESRVRSGSGSGSGAGADDSAAALYRLSLNLKSDVDDALGAEFGWGLSRTSSQDSVMAGGQPPAIAVGGGVVAGARSVRDSLGRAPSDGSERGALGSVREDEDDDDEDVDEGDRRRRNLDDASRALLGESRGDGRSHPELLRPGRPKSEIEFVITPPPKSPGANSRSTWGNAYSR